MRRWAGLQKSKSRFLLSKRSDEFLTKDRYAGLTCDIQLVAYGAFVYGFHVRLIEVLNIIKTIGAAINGFIQ
jgi:hypothetical protein